MEKEDTLLRAVINASQGAMVLVDYEGVITLVNRRTTELFGYSQDELLGSRVETLLPESIREKHVSYRSDYVENPVPRQMGAGRELFGLHKDGYQIPLEIGLNPLVYKDVKYVLASIVDISEKKRREGLFYQAIESAPNGMVVVDAEGKILFVNHKMVELFGYLKEEVFGKTIEIFLPQEVKEKHVSLRSNYTANPIPRQMGEGRDLFGLHKEGRKVPVEIGLNPVKIDGKTHIIASIIDISTRKKQEAMLKSSNEELQNFAYVASHDLQEPLRKVQSFGSLLVRECMDALGEEGKMYVQEMMHSSDRMQTLIQDLLSLSRVSTEGKKPMAVSLEEVTQRALDDLSESIKEANAKIDIHVSGKAEIDASQIERVITNLIANALKYRASDRQPEIYISTNEQFGSIEFIVKDNGIGFDMQYAEKIFVIFQRLHGRDEYQGTGIGLAVCKKIIERHNGVIWAEAEEGKGSAFHFKIPVVQPHLERF